MWLGVYAYGLDVSFAMGDWKCSSLMSTLVEETR